MIGTFKSSELTDSQCQVQTPTRPGCRRLTSGSVLTSVRAATFKAPGASAQLVEFKAHGLMARTGLLLLWLHFGLVTWATGRASEGTRKLATVYQVQLIALLAVFRSLLASSL
jgi:hypothetical protein